MCRSPLALTVRSMREWRAKSSSMWSRKPIAVEIDRDLDIGLLGAAPDGAFAHERIFRLEPRALYQGSTAFATLAGHRNCTLSGQGLHHCTHRIRACSPYLPTPGTAPPS